MIHSALNFEARIVDADKASDDSMRRSGLCLALALCFFGIPATKSKSCGIRHGL